MRHCESLVVNVAAENRFVAAPDLRFFAAEKRQRIAATAAARDVVLLAAENSDYWFAAGACNSARLADNCAVVPRRLLVGSKQAAANEHVAFAVLLCTCFI